MICNIDKFYPYRFPKKRLWIWEDIEIINYSICIQICFKLLSSCSDSFNFVDFLNRGTQVTIETMGVATLQFREN